MARALEDNQNQRKILKAGFSFPRPRELSAQGAVGILGHGLKVVFLIAASLAVILGVSYLFGDDSQVKSHIKHGYNSSFEKEMVYSRTNMRLHL